MLDSIMESYDAFHKVGVEHPLLETLRLCDVLSQGALRRMDPALLAQEGIDLSHLARKRKEGMPLEYIIGRATFMGLLLFCSPATLIPREETELLARTALDLIKRRQEPGVDLTVIDVGTGCGNIAVALATNAAGLRILASDISSAAVEVAQENIDQFDLQERISLYCGDLFSPFQGLGYERRIDLIVCNPPYIPTGSLGRLAREIIDHEPRVALDAGPYGIGFYRRLVTDSLPLLRPQGVLVFEIGKGQEKLVTRLLERTRGYQGIEHYRDSAQIRVISAVRRLGN